eukprot:gene6925-7660_t
MSTGPIWLTTYHCDVDSIDKWIKWWMSWLPLKLFRAAFPGTGRRLTPADSQSNAGSINTTTIRDVSTSPTSNGTARSVGGKMGSNSSSNSRAYMALPTSDPTEPDTFVGSNAI